VVVAGHDVGVAAAPLGYAYWGPSVLKGLCAVAAADKPLAATASATSAPQLKRTNALRVNVVISFPLINREAGTQAIPYVTVERF
jgi:hypothetical protein